MAVQDKYGFKAREFHAAGFANVAEYKKEHGSDLFIRDIDEYDRICKVAPLQAVTVLTGCAIALINPRLHIWFQNHWARSINSRDLLRAGGALPAVIE